MYHGTESALAETAKTLSRRSKQASKQKLGRRPEWDNSRIRLSQCIWKDRSALSNPFSPDKKGWLGKPCKLARGRKQTAFPTSGVPCLRRNAPSSLVASSSRCALSWGDRTASTVVVFLMPTSDPWTEPVPSLLHIKSHTQQCGSNRNLFSAATSAAGEAELRICGKK